MELIREFKHLGRHDAPLAGGKGASLGEMTQAGIPIPPGFVVLAHTFDRFLAETDLTQEIEAILATVRHDEMHTVERASEKIQGLILAATMPADIASAIMAEYEKLGAEFVAVRSSATAEDGAEHAWAGQLDTHLNTPKEEVLRNVQRCWASLFTPRAIFYRFEKGLHGTTISVAVVIQKMVQSEISGIAFSVHPVTEDRNQLIIEAGFGLGEAIVSGQVTPDSYVAEKEPRRIIDINVSEQGRALYRKEGGGNEWHELGEKGKTQVLTEAQILELAELIVHIEKHYGFPCDIEWAFESGNFYITQSRPITTLSSPSADSPLAAGGMAEPFEGAWDTDRWLQLGRWLQKPLPSSFWGEKTVPAYFERFFPGHQFSPVFDIHGYYHIARADLDFVIDHFVALHEAGAMRGYIDSLDIAGRELETLYSELLPPDRITARSLKDIFAEHEKLTSFWYAITLVGDALTPAAIKSGVTASEGDFLGLVHPYLRKTWIEDEEMLVRTIATEALRHHDMPTLEQVRELRTGDSEVHELFSLHDARYGWVGISKWEGQPQTEEKLCARVCDASGFPSGAGCRST